MTGRAVFLSYSSSDLAAATAARPPGAAGALRLLRQDRAAGGRPVARPAASGGGRVRGICPPRRPGRRGAVGWGGDAGGAQPALWGTWGRRPAADLSGPARRDRRRCTAGVFRLFQATSWDGASPPAEPLLAAIRDRTLLQTEAKPLEGPPFVGPAAFRTDQAHLFFGRQQETLAALSCFDTRSGHAAIRWLEINGTSGSGKSSLMQAGLLPLIDQGLVVAAHRNCPLAADRADIAGGAAGGDAGREPGARVQRGWPICSTS